MIDRLNNVAQSLHPTPPSFVIYWSGRSIEPSIRFVDACLLSYALQHNNLIYNHLSIAANLMYCDVPWVTIQMATQGVVFRMATHSPYDRDTLVPKLCLNPQDRTLLPASPTTLDPRGSFVVQPPGPQPDGQRRLYVWRGKQATQESVAVAQEFAYHLNRVEKLECEVVLVEEGGGDDSFAGQLLVESAPVVVVTYDDLVPKAEERSDSSSSRNNYSPPDLIATQLPMTHVVLTNTSPPAITSPLPPTSSPPQESSSSSSSSPKLYRLVIMCNSNDSNGETASWEWEDMGVYDADDLESESGYLLHDKAEGLAFLWIGKGFSMPGRREREGNDEEGGVCSSSNSSGRGDLTHRIREECLQRGLLKEFDLDARVIRIELEGEETEDFWTLLDGY